jgi:hypothetical protein
MTTRKPLRFPRTFAQAFPQSTEYACAIERPARRSISRAWIAMAVILAALLLAQATR